MRSQGVPPNTGRPSMRLMTFAPDRPWPDTRHGIGSPSSTVCSTAGRSVQRPQRRSSPNQLTTSDTDSTAGSSARSWSSEASMSGTP